MDNGRDFLPDDHDVDPLEDVIIWTPAIERLAQDVARWVRLDTPGGTAIGKQRTGKSSACDYLAVVLSSIIGYPIAVVKWRIPHNGSSKEREFTQERLQQSDCTAVLHRDVAVLRGRLYDHIAQLTDAICARRVVIIVDEAQNLEREHYGYLVHCFNELVHRKLRPFFLLIGQPELETMVHTWAESRRHQVVGRFHVNKHIFHGISLSEVEAVLAELDKPMATGTLCAAAATFPEAYAAGWRIADLAPVLSEAIGLAMRVHNLSSDVRIPMQYLRSTVLAFLYRAAELRMDPRKASGAFLLRCLRDSGFLSVIAFYVETTSDNDSSDSEKDTI
jgi:hypothetical protein